MACCAGKQFRSNMHDLLGDGIFNSVGPKTPQVSGVQSYFIRNRTVSNGSSNARLRLACSGRPQFAVVVATVASLNSPT